MAIKKVTELDFDTIKTNLKAHMQNQEEFTDYNFDASGLAVIIDLLAYNTHYNAVMAHMVANEAFIDSAVKRNSVVSIGKTMGYTPRSARSAKATIDLTITPASTYTSNTLVLGRNTQFTTSVNGVGYSFYPSQDYTVTKTTNASGVGQFVFTDIELIEGTRTETSEIISANNTSGPIILPNANVDTTTIRTRVKENSASSATTTYNVSDTIIAVDNTSKVFYVDESVSGFYQVSFGDGTLGVKLAADNIVIIDYIISSGPVANGASRFNIPVQITGAGETVVGNVTANSAGGAFREDTDSIRYNAPRFNATKNRAITYTDYETLIRSANPNVKAVTVWGGEDNDPPIYGKVFVSLQPRTGLVITEQEKQNLLDVTIKPRQPITMLTEFVEPEYTYVGLNITATYDNKITTLSGDAIKALIIAEVENYFDTNLNMLRKNFYYSVLTKRLAALSDSIIGINMELTLQKRLEVGTNTATRYQPNFHNKIMPNSLRTNHFQATVNNASYKVGIVDKPASTVVAPQYSGTGTLQLKDVGAGTIINENIGTIDYDTGKLDVTSLTISEITGTANTVLNFNVTPHESSKNVSTDLLIRQQSDTTYAVTQKASRNNVINLDQNSADTTNNIMAGVNVTMIARTLDS
tara:strand:- start:171 stop:2087 length:1917 start_codon:yes stop_codon:yes gene_type:complete